ncbi:SDR family oxidoreductase [uncultured Mucilaginibacter sp.]|uniref:SDR family oxidoreductase n=1 Tax=uncultured Mucilaginibacter sp. TaxID=797541 RepID=UPI0026145B81|nr:SDR family oxidoreductase [uncultured Mucilaginibacter sp.]
MKVLIIGASGLVGSNLYQVFGKNNKDGINLGTHLSYSTDHSVYFDPLKEVPIEISKENWDVIIHTGALTNVDQCETEQDLSYQLTVASTQMLLLLAKNNNSKFVYLSTDYVFNGENGPYIETDKVEPLNVYGKHKLEAEKLVLTYPDHLILRITNVYGNEIRNKNFIARILDSVKQKEFVEIKAPVDQLATPVNAADVAKAIYLLVQDNRTGIYHLASTDYLSRVQLLQRINAYYANKIKIIPVKTASLNQAALRPLRGGLIAAKFASEYPDFIFSNVDDYLKKQ